MTTNAEAEKNPIVNSLRVAERWLAPLAKIGAAIVTFTYFLGFLVTAWRLYEYGITLSRLVDIQYLVVGAIPMTVLLMIAAAIYLGWHFAQVREGIGLEILVLAMIISVPLFWMYDQWKKGRVPVDELQRQMTQFVTQGAPWWFFVIGWLVLWAMTASTKKALYSIRMLKAGGDDDQHPEAKADKDDSKQSETKHDEETSSTKTEKRPRSSRIKDLVVLLSIYFIAVTILSVAVISTFPTMAHLYLNLPQTVGGGSPIVVEMYVDGSKAPPDLLSQPPIPDAKLAAKTVPLTLIYRTPDYYIVKAYASTPGPVWVLSSDNVYAVRKSPR